MPSFGGYTSVRELHRSGTGSVYAAVRDAEPSAPPAYALRVCAPDARIVGPDGTERIIAAFLEEIAALKGVSDHPRGQARWARVHGVGRTDLEHGPGACAVVDLAVPGTFDWLARGRVALDGPTLARLMGEVVDALRDLEGAEGRPHGALKGSDVLLVGPPGAEISACRVLLADPLPRARLTPAARTADLRSIGELIYLLVLHEPYARAWPVEWGAAWKALGTGSSRWVELVNALLNPNEGAERPNLEELAARIAKLRAMPRTRKPLYIGLAAGLLVLGATAAVVVPWALEPRREWTPQTSLAWDELCAACSLKDGWYQSLARSLDAPPFGALKGAGPTLRAALAAKDPALAEMLKDHAAPKALAPWTIAGLSASGQLPEAAPDKAKSGRGIVATEAALASIHALRDNLEHTWAGPARLAAAESAYRARGWTSAADAVKAAADGVQIKNGTALGPALETAVAAADGTARIDASWAKADEAVKLVEAKAGSDAALAKLRPSLDAMFAPAAATAGSDTLASAAARGAEAAEACRTLADAVAAWDALDLPALREAPAYKALAAAERLEAAPLAAFAAEVPGYRRVTDALDPREPLAGALRAVDAQVAELTSESLEGELDADSRSTLEGAREGVAAVGRLPRIVKTTAEIAEASSRLARQLDGLKTALDAKIADRRRIVAASAADVERSLREGGPVVEGSPAINAAWDAWRAAMLRDFKVETYKRTRDQKAALAKALADLNAAFPAAPAAAGAADIERALAAAAAAERDRRLGAALTRLGPGVPPPSAVTAIAGADGPAFTAFAADVGAIASALAPVERALGAATDASAGTEALRAIDALPPREAARAPEVAAAVSALRAQAQAIVELGSKTSPAELSAVITGAGPADAPKSMVAWRRLASDAVAWPRTAEDLDGAAALHRTLSGALDRAALPPDRKADFARAADAGLARAWAKFARSRPTPAEFRAAAARRADFRVDDAALDPPLRYNLLVTALHTYAEGDHPDAEVRRRLADFRAAAGPLGVAVPPQADSVLRTIEDPNAKTGPALTEVGPATQGWMGTLESDGVVRFAKGAVTLRFLRLPTASPTQEQAVYLCDRELSVQDAGVILGPRGLESIRDLVPEDDGLHARSWLLGPSGLAARKSWIDAGTISAAEPAYAPSIAQPGTPATVAAAAGGEPTLAHPFQYVSPEVFEAIARAGGCRIPTVAEWQSAYRAEAAAPAGNLRDDVFAAQWQYIDSKKKDPSGRPLPATPKTEQFHYPDEEALVPATAPSSAGAADRVLWFQPAAADTGGRFHNLVGNVAELVTDGRVRRAIGGSALSAWGKPYDQPVDLPKALDQFTDLGCRLAFDGPAQPPLVKTLLGVMDRAYVLGPALSPGSRP
jgi:hypothetical protein